MGSTISVKLMGGRDRIIAQVEAPSGVVSLYATSAHHLPANRLGLASSVGSGIWGPKGELIWWSPETTAITCDGEFLLCAENTFARITGDSEFAVVHRLVRREMTGFEVVGSCDLPVRMGGVEHLICGDEGLACVWMDQTEWGVTFLDLRGGDSVLSSAYVPHLLAGRPVWFQDKLYGVSRFGSVWWRPDGDWFDPSLGGDHVLGWLSAVSPNSALTEAAVVVCLEAGWIPDDPEDPDFNTIWGPELVDGRLRIWLPDGSLETVAPPVTSPIRVERAISTGTAGTS